MKKRRILVCVLALGLLLALAVGLSQAQGPEPPEGEVRPQGETGVTADVSAVIPIQGRLTAANGTPLNGTYSIRFRLYDAASGGSVVCEDTNSVEVTNGLFNSEIGGTCDSSDINGQQLYLGIKVGADDEMVPRQAIYPVPYAFSLRPGAVISETTSYVGLNRYVSTIPFTYKYGVYAKASGAFYNIGVAGYSEGNYGAGVLGSTDSSLGYGGHFLNTAANGVGLYASAGDGNTADIELGANSDTVVEDNGRIHSTTYNSSDLYLASNGDVVIELDENDDEKGYFHVVGSDMGLPTFTVDESGNVDQDRMASGLVKAAVYADCRNSGSSIVRSFPTGWGEATIADGASAGRCTIHFNLPIDNRYFAATALTSDGGNARGVSCDWGADPSWLDCFRWNDAGSGANGEIMVLIY